MPLAAASSLGLQASCPLSKRDTLALPKIWEETKMLKHGDTVMRFLKLVSPKKTFVINVPVDFGARCRKNAFMQVTLTQEIEKFVDQKIRGGGYTNPSEVVRDALRDLRSKDNFVENDSQELAELLLTAVRGKHRPLTAKHFSQLRARARRV